MRTDRERGRETVRKRERDRQRKRATMPLKAKPAVMIYSFCFICAHGERDNDVWRLVITNA